MRPDHPSDHGEPDDETAGSQQPRGPELPIYEPDEASGWLIRMTISTNEIDDEIDLEDDDDDDEDETCSRTSCFPS